MRKVVVKILAILAALAAVSLGLLADIWFEVNIPTTVSVSIRSAKMPAGRSVRLVQISDVHAKPIAVHKGLMEKISAFDPSAILISGDLIDRSTDNFDGVYKDVESLEDIAPVIFVSGNHELANPRGESFISGLKREGVMVLRNASTSVGKTDGSSEVVIAGIEDVHFGHDDLDRTTKDLTDATFNILLSHTPSVAPSVERWRNIDLVLSGHTHGGQVRLPFFGAVFLPDKGLDPRLISGLTTLENGVTVYTDSGFGTSVIPVRFMDRSRISLITISGIDK